VTDDFTLGDILKAGDSPVREVVSDFLATDADDAKVVLVLWRDDKGVFYRYGGTTNLVDILGMLAWAAQTVYADNENNLEEDDCV